MAKTKAQKAAEAKAAKAAKVTEEAKAKVAPLEVPGVTLGVGTINNHERRLCLLEKKLGLR